VPITTKGGVVQELDAQATVVDAGGISGGLTTTIARSEVESALKETELPPLVLDVRRGETESNSIAVAWKRDDLERLLGEATGDQIQLTFDRGAIESAFDDVEAHGMREKVAVIAVAVAGAAALAGGASAMPMGESGGGPAAVPIASGPSGAHLGDTTAVAAPAVSFAQGPSGAHLGDTTGGTAAADVPIASGPSGAHLGDTTGVEAPAVALAQGPSGAHIGDTIGNAPPPLNTETGPSGAHLGDTTGGEPAIQYATDDGTSLGDVGAGVAAVGAGALILIAGAAFMTGSRRRNIPAT
jgi:hypothetical protein